MNPYPRFLFYSVIFSTVSVDLGLTNKLKSKRIID
jgi:hypothetical protein